MQKTTQVKRTGMYADWRASAFNSGRWFLVSKDLFLIMDPEMACAFSLICNIGGMEEQKGKTIGGKWFRCSSKQLMENLKITQRAHRRITKALEDMKLVKKKMIGIPAARYMTIDYKHLEVLLQRAALDNQTGT